MELRLSFADPAKGILVGLEDLQEIRPLLGKTFTFS